MLKTKKANLLDVVELAEDLPKYNVKRGEQGVVVEVFDEPEEAYILEFADPSGASSKLAYWVKPEQVINIYAIAREAFDYGLALLKEGKPFEAGREIQRAIDLIPALIVNLHNLILARFGNTDEWEDFIVALRLVLQLNPGYEVEGFNMEFFARNNLAMVYQNYAAQMAKEGDIQTALLYFNIALGMGSRPETISLIRKNLSRAYTMLGTQAAQNKNYDDSIARMHHACEVDLNDMTRRNLGIAYVQAAQHHLKQRDYENSITFFEHAIDIGLIFPELFNNYGMALAAVGGHQDQAILAFHRALKLSPDNEIIQRNLNLVEVGTNVGFSTAGIEAEFPPTPPMQKQEYLKAA